MFLVVGRDENCGFAKRLLYCAMKRNESSRVNCRFHFVRMMLLLKTERSMGLCFTRSMSQVLSICRRSNGFTPTVAFIVVSSPSTGSSPVGTTKTMAPLRKVRTFKVSCRKGDEKKTRPEIVWMNLRLVVSPG